MCSAIDRLHLQPVRAAMNGNHGTDFWVHAVSCPIGNRAQLSVMMLQSILMVLNITLKIELIREMNSRT